MQFRLSRFCNLIGLRFGRLTSLPGYCCNFLACLRYMDMKNYGIGPVPVFSLFLLHLTPLVVLRPKSYTFIRQQQPNHPDFMDSGAIMVSAATSALPHQRMSYSNYGARIDCFACFFFIVFT